jgi:site-specific recombinase XerD
VSAVDVDERWRGALAEWAEWRGAGFSPVTTDQLMALLNTFARGVDVAPWAVTAQDIQRYFERRQLSPSSVRSYRKAIASLYTFGHRAGRVDASPLPPANLERAAVSAQWEDALERWARREVDRGIQASTIATRLKNLRRFAAQADENPWLVTADQVEAWTTDGPGVKITRDSARSSLKAFYRWAHGAGHVREDPAAAPSRRATALLAPPAWESQLEAYRRHLRAEGRPESTIALQMTQLRRFGRENATVAPFDVDLATIVDWLANKRWEPATRQSHRSSLRGFYRWAKLGGHLAKNPTSKLPSVKATLYSARPASSSALAAALAGADPRERLALRLASELGLRCAEVACVHSNDLSVTPNSAGVDEWSLRVHGKGRKNRVLPLTESLAIALRARGEGFAFPGAIAGHISPQYLGKLLSALLPAGVTMHMLRHRFATEAYNVDRDVFTVQQLLGHASPATTQVYVQVSDSRMRHLVVAVAGA